MSASEVIIRDAVFDDIPGMASLVTELGYQTTVDEMKSRYALIAQHPDYKTIIAVENNAVVGMAGLCKGLFYEMNGMYMRILVFVVRRDKQKQGIGKLLLQASENWAREHELKTILLNSGNRDERTDAHAFYKNMGYTIKSSGFVKHL